MTPAELLAPLAARGVNLDLGAMREALRASGDPHLAVPCVHVAGTNGKGSVTALVHEALVAQGYRVGRYTSPHLHRVAERVVINGAPLDDAAMCDEVLRVRDERARGVLPPLSLFESLTLIAWRAFARAGVDLAVMEVGVGGRLDATNLCAPVLTAITRIAFDHTAWLGDTLAAIAGEKAGICKRDVPCVLGPALRTGEAREAIARIAASVGAPCLDATLPAVHDDECTWDFRGEALRARLALDGAYPRENASTAVAICAALNDRGVRVSTAAVARALARTQWPGRMERIGDVLLDAAHNDDGLAALGDALREVPVGAVVFGASRDKDLDAMAARVRRFAPDGARFATAAAMERATPPAELAARIAGEAVADPAAAVLRARARCAPGQVVLVCGSIFLVAAVRAHLLGITAEPPMAM
ncbi:MAG: bifunctional folylpolyglutamate synthase/dihydrofolate synthase [Polyangiales bacterium]